MNFTHHVIFIIVTINRFVRNIHTQRNSFIVFELQLYVEMMKVFCECENLYTLEKCEKLRSIFGKTESVVILMEILCSLGMLTVQLTDASNA